MLNFYKKLVYTSFFHVLTFVIKKECEKKFPCRSLLLKVKLLLKCLKLFTKREGYDRPAASLFFLVVVKPGPVPSAGNIV